MILRQIQQEAGNWTKKNFPNQKPHQPLLGAIEEFGELLEAFFYLFLLGTAVGRLCHAFLKDEQGIRGTKEERKAKLRDAIGDMFVFLLNLCNALHFDALDILQETWDEVKKRDWTKNKTNGVTQ